MDLRFDYDTYQDVRRNLCLYSIPVTICAGFFVFLRVLPSPTQQIIGRFLERASSTQPLKDLLGTGIGFAAFTAIAFLLTEIIQIHDQWYDKYIIRWRHRYATDFILPRLLQPWLGRTNFRIFDAIDKDVRTFQERLYYPFVGDRDLKIPKNKLVRFYEVITVYWLTQINEIILLALTLTIIFYRYCGPAESAYRTMLFDNLAFVVAAFVLNRAWVRASIAKVRRATEEEIWAILDDPALRSDLERHLQRLCKDYSIPYGETDQD
jgi:hypothetical protein